MKKESVGVVANSNGDSENGCNDYCVSDVGVDSVRKLDGKQASNASDEESIVTGESLTNEEKESGNMSTNGEQNLVERNQITAELYQNDITAENADSSCDDSVDTHVSVNALVVKKKFNDEIVVKGILSSLVLYSNLVEVCIESIMLFKNALPCQGGSCRLSFFNSAVVLANYNNGEEPTFSSLVTSMLSQRSGVSHSFSDALSKELIERIAETLNQSRFRKGNGYRASSWIRVRNNISDRSYFQIGPCFYPSSFVIVDGNSQ